MPLHTGHHHVLGHTPAKVTVTRRHHPLRGVELMVRAEVGRNNLVVELPDGSGMQMPRAWTDADGQPTEASVALPSILTVDALRELAELVAILRTRG